MTSPEFVRFMTTMMRHLCAFSEDGSLHLMFISYHFLLELLRAGAIVYNELKAAITWDKGSPGHANVHNHFNLERHLVDRQTYKDRRSAALAEWQSLAS